MSKPIKDQRIIVVGASRGLGRAIALALSDAGASVLALARDAAALDNLRQSSEAAPRRCIDVQVDDATNPSVAARTMNREEPDALFIVAGATPVMRPLNEYRWESFCDNWNTDVKATFHWLQEGVNKPMRDGSRIVVFSSGAAMHGSPLSGGYTTAKQAQRYLCDTMRIELLRMGRNIGIQCVLPQLNPNTGLGMEGVRAYASRAAESPADYVRQRFGANPLTPALTGSEMVRLLSHDELKSAPEFLLTGAGLKPLDKSSAKA